MAQGYAQSSANAPIMKMGGACVARTTNQTIAHNTSTEMSYDAVLYDDAGYWSSVDPTAFVIPPGLGGRYTLTAWTTFAPNATGNRQLFVQIDGVTYPTQRSAAFATQSGGLTLPFTFDINAGSRVVFWVFQTSGGDLDISGISASIQRVGLAAGTNPTGPITTSALTCADNVLLGRIGAGAAGTISEISFEEGTWLPTFTFDTVGDLSVSYAIQYGRYQRIGSMINFWLRLNCTPTFSTSSGNVRISLPFLVRNEANHIPVFAVDIGTSTAFPTNCTMLFGEASLNTSYAVIGARGSSALGAMATGQFTSGAAREVRMSGCYLTT